MKTAVIILAAGRGSRAGGAPKQWREIAGLPVVAHTLARFQTALPQATLLLVHPKGDVPQIMGMHETCEGGATRAHSVLNGLTHLEGRGITHVLIHDGARCCVPQELITQVHAALADAPAAFPAIAVTDALWQASGGHVSAQTPEPRDTYHRAQTPQGFDFATILAAHRAYDAAKHGEAGDDVAVARAHGVEVTLVAGHENNIKITGPQDFARAEALIGGGQLSMDVRTGNGFDVHRFGAGDHVMLCGVKIPHSQGLVGHSDADVALHTITDALYGALAEGDIGRHFPPSDPQWKGAASDLFLRHAAELAAARGFTISNVDCTLICEEPKITPHAPLMIARLAEILDLEAARISVKATTSEQLGFAGRKEGIAAMATATLVKP